VVWLDAYERRARLIPGLIALLPLPILVFTLGLRQQPVVAGIASLLTAVGLPVLLVSTVRIRGLTLQDQLYAKCGGAPTTECLRHRGPEADAARREQWRSEVTRVVGHSLPTAPEEANDEGAADGRYVTAVAKIIEATRDPKKFDLVFKENMNYGFDRNLLAMRPIGIWIAALGVVIAAGTVLAQGVWGVGLSALSVTIGLVVQLILLAVWLVIPNENRVHRIGRRYAERLLDSVSRL
jgi:hypothetical protein